MTSTEPIAATVLREHRTDRAERTLTLANTPAFEYQARISYRNRAMKTVRWVARNLRLTWDQGDLIQVHLGGVKLKQDGTEGSLRVGVDFQVKGGMVQDAKLPYPADGFMEAPGWLLAVVALHSTVPPFKGLAEVGA